MGRRDAKEQERLRVGADAALKEFWRANETFADLFNTTVFGGQTVIEAQYLQDADTDEAIVSDDRKGHPVSHKAARDLIKLSKMYHGRYMLCLYAAENQINVHYTMPVRVMGYDYMEYQKQWDRIRTEHRKRGDLSGDEFLSGFSKTDRLVPVVTLVLYYGERAWDGAKSLQEMMDLPEGLRQFVPDYRINLVEVRNRYNGFCNEEVGAFFGLMNELLEQHHTRLEKRQTIQTYLKDKSVSRTLLLAVLGAARAEINYEELRSSLPESMNGGAVMCTFFEDLKREGYEDGLEAGINQGIQQGISQGINQGIYRGKIELLLEDGHSISEIAARLKLSEVEVTEIAEQIKEMVLT